MCGQQASQFTNCQSHGFLLTSLRFGLRSLSYTKNGMTRWTMEAEAQRGGLRCLAALRPPDPIGTPFAKIYFTSIRPWQTWPACEQPARMFLLRKETVMDLFTSRFTYVAIASALFATDFSRAQTP